MSGFLSAGIVGGSDTPDSWTQNADHEFGAQDLSASEDDTIDPFLDGVGANDLTATGSPFYETNTNIGETSVSTDGADNYYLSNSYNGAGSPLSIAFVFEPLTTSGDNDIFEFGTGDTAVNLRIANGSWEINIPSDSSNSGGSAVANETYAGVVATDGSTLVLEVADQIVIDTSVGTGNNTGVSISRNLGNADNQGNSNIHILRSFTEFKDATERDNIVSYLEQKFNFISSSP